MKKILSLILISISALTAFSQRTTSPERGRIYVSGTTVKAEPKKPKAPDEIWGKLFVDIQLNRVLGDNKTFVDAVPKFSPQVILKKYQEVQKANDTSFKLKDFVFQNFKVPVPVIVKPSEKAATLKKHLEDLWPTLTRKADVIEKNTSLLPLPKAYVVPGGRFREIYYWDSYFTMLGLAVSNRYDLIESMLDNFKYLIDTYGHIPNGNRTYYLSRSQPPYFALMVELLHDKFGDRVYRKYLSALQKEYGWWMEGEKELSPGNSNRRVVRLEDGTVLNRYWDDKKAPREESYYEDVQTGFVYQNGDQMVYTNLRAGAESGWDFSSRWFADTMNLTSIETTNILPVDLNCLLYAYENILSKASRSQQLQSQANSYQQKALKRKAAILTFFWNDEEHYFFDYHYVKQTTTNRWALAGVLPLFTQVATAEQAGYVKDHIEQKFLKDGGLVTTPYHTNQQWDAPNGWAPLQFLGVKALMNYRYDTLAKNIAERWMSVNETVYANTGKMLEKYNVEDIHLLSGGGEYPTQDGFGWSNGVYLKFYQLFRRGER
ncbi:MAG: treA [Segetibacter sp.]|nr:treA [Segetibacter sp.]